MGESIVEFTGVHGGRRIAAVRVRRNGYPMVFVSVNGDHHRLYEVSSTETAFKMACAALDATDQLKERTLSWLQCKTCGSAVFAGWEDPWRHSSIDPRGVKCGNLRVIRIYLDNAYPTEVLWPLDSTA